MVVDDPPLPRHKTQDLGDTLIISVPSRKKLGFILVLSLGALTWLDLEFLIIGLFSRFLSRESYLLFLVVWSGVGIFVIYPLAWQLFGKEEIQVANQFIKISKVVLGFKRSKEYPENQVTDLGLTRSDYGPDEKINEGLISFIYDAQDTDQYITFAKDVNGDFEAEQIIAEIQQRFPQYKR